MTPLTDLDDQAEAVVSQETPPIQPLTDAIKHNKQGLILIPHALWQQYPERAQLVLRHFLPIEIKPSQAAHGLIVRCYSALFQPTTEAPPPVYEVRVRGLEHGAIVNVRQVGQANTWGVVSQWTH